MKTKTTPEMKAIIKIAATKARDVYRKYREGIECAILPVIKQIEDECNIDFDEPINMVDVIFDDMISGSESPVSEWVKDMSDSVFAYQRECLISRLKEQIAELENQQ